MTPAYYINASRPINGAHKLSRGLVARYRNVPNPGWRGGLTLRDLCGRYHGTFSEVPYKVADHYKANVVGRKGGYGSYYFFGSAGGRLTVPSGVAPTGDMTMALWLFSTNTAQQSQNAIGWYTSDADGMEIGYFPGTNRELYGGNYTNRALSGNTSVLDNTWYRVMLTSISGGATQFYLNGTARGTAGTTNFATRSFAMSIGCRIGPDPPGTTSYTLGGGVDDVCIWNRALSAGEAAADYYDQTRTIPESLNWIGSGPITVESVATVPSFLITRHPIHTMPHLRM